MREWHKEGHSKLIEKGTLKSDVQGDSYSKIKEIIKKHNIEDRHIIIDSNWNQEWVLNIAQNHTKEFIIYGKKEWLGMILANGQYRKTGYKYNKAQNSIIHKSNIKLPNGKEVAKLSFISTRLKDYLVLLR